MSTLEKHTIRSQCRVILASNIYSEYPSYIVAINVSLKLLSKMCDDKEDLTGMVTLSSIVFDNLYKFRTVYKYQEYLVFLESADNIFLGYETFREYLIRSVINRHYLIPDYDTDEDIEDALESAYRPRLSDVEIMSFYFLIKQTDKGDPKNEARAAKAWQLLYDGWISYASKKSYVFTNPDSLPPSTDSQIPFQGYHYQNYIYNIAPDKGRDVLELTKVLWTKNFNTPLIHKLIKEFTKPEYDNFCPGSEKFRQFLIEKALVLPLQF
jgi:hypothetical protein